MSAGIEIEIEIEKMERVAMRTLPSAFALLATIILLVGCASPPPKVSATEKLKLETKLEAKLAPKPDETTDSSTYLRDSNPATSSAGQALPPSMAGATTDEKSAELRSAAPVYSQLGAKKSRNPLQGSFAQGEALLKRADAAKEADAVLEMRGFQLVYVCGFACLTPGASTEQAEVSEMSNHATIPATGDVINKENKSYNERAQEFALRFNKRMIFKSHLNSAIPPTFTVDQLTINGVTIGKSNLYNAIGKFGPNTIKRALDLGGATDYSCYVGDDGTVLAFESVADEGGGRDQDVTAIKIFNKDSAYAFKDQCKPSKKVNAALEINGFKLGGPATTSVNYYALPVPIKSKKSNSAAIKSVMVTITTEASDGVLTGIAVLRQESR